MGKFIVLDGLDGSGKETQTNLLAARLRGAGEDVKVLSYPRYGEKSAVPVELYLNGFLGERPDDTGAYAASVLFAVDRYLSYRLEWQADYEKGNFTFLANRYTSSNAVHQLSKLPRGEWDAFLDWLWDFEYGKLGIPHPDRVLYLEMRPDLSRRLIEQRGNAQDIHERDPSYLSRCYEAALYAADRLRWTTVRCFEGDRILSIEEISALIDESVFSPKQ